MADTKVAPEADTQVTPEVAINPIVVEGINDDSFLQGFEDDEARIAIENNRRKYGGSPIDFQQRSVQEVVEGAISGGAKIEGHKKEPTLAGKIAREAGAGLRELPSAVGSAGTTAIQETIDFVQEVGDAIESIMPPALTDVLTPNALRIKTPRMPQIAGPTSASGNMIKSVSQFLFGFVGAGKLKMMKALKPVTRKGKTAKAMAQGAIADLTVFDGQDQQLSNMLQENPGLYPVFHLLAKNPDDPELINRARGMVEGLGWGAATDGIVMGLRAGVKWKTLRKEAKSSKTDVEVDVPVALTERQMMEQLLGDPAEDLVYKKLYKEPVLGEYAEFDINWSKVETTDDIKRIMQLMADVDASEVKKGTRGVRTWDRTVASAGHENAWKLIVDRIPGGTFNAEQLYAVKKLWVTSGNKLGEVSIITARNPSKENLAAYSQMEGVHRLIQREFLGAKAEAGRALNILAKKTGGDEIFASQLDDLLMEGGGERTLKAKAEKIASLYKKNDMSGLDLFNRGSAWAKTRDAVVQLFYFSLLTNPASHSANIGGNTGMLGVGIVERKLASVLSNVLGETDGVKTGEAMSMMTTMVRSFKDILSAAIKESELPPIEVWKDARQSAPSFGTSLRKATNDFTGAPMVPSSGKLPFSVTREQGSFHPDTLGITNTALGKHFGPMFKMLDMLTKSPGTALREADDIMKGFAARMEADALITRRIRQMVDNGEIDESMMAQMKDKLYADMPDDVLQGAMGFARYSTFTNMPADQFNFILNAPRDLDKYVPGLGTFILPFRQTPANLMSAGLERMPGFNFMMQNWRADMKAGGARRKLAEARIMLGTFVFLAAMDMSVRGQITGGPPTNPSMSPGWDARGNQPYAVFYNTKDGEESATYSRFEPLGTILGVGADVGQLLLNADESLSESDAETVSKIVQTSILYTAKSIVDKTVFQGFARTNAAIMYPSMAGEAWFKQLAGVTVPAGVAAVRRQMDPYALTVNGMLDAVKAKLPYWSKDLPAHHDIWGRTRDYRSGRGKIFDLFSPVYIRQYDPMSIDIEMQRVGYNPSYPDKQFVHRDRGFVGKINLDNHPHAYEDYKVFTATLVPIDDKDTLIDFGKQGDIKMNMVDYLNALVEGRHYYSKVYNIMTDVGKQGWIQASISNYRKAAQIKLMKEYPELESEFNAVKQRESKIQLD